MLDFDKLTPKQIVEELDKYIIGQDKAKRTVAMALRNRVRRKMLPESLREEHNHDWFHRCRQDRDSTASFKAFRCAVRKGRGDKIYRGRLCGTRC